MMSPDNQTKNTNFDDACAFIIKLGEAAHGYGSTDGRLEVYLTRLTEAFGYHGAFRISATDMICAFQEGEHQPQQMHMRILPGAGLDLSKLALVGDLVDALQLAGLRGVDVRILIPDKPDHLLVYLAAFSYFNEAGRTGVRFFRYTDGFLHQKAMLIDGEAATVGTANFDNRSFRLNFEITAVVLDPAFAAEVERMFENDFKNSREMHHQELEKKSFGFKLAVRLARLTSPVQ